VEKGKIEGAQCTQLVVVETQGPQEKANRLEGDYPISTRREGLKKGHCDETARKVTVK